MNTPISIKQAGPEDLEALAALFNEYRIFYEQASDMEGATRFCRNGCPGMNPSYFWLSMRLIKRRSGSRSCIHPSLRYR
ncbi:hypothetical protein HMSSN036_51140 [Paenibacillus macerans]|nr:hypothetical protein HMSSN036_51140 [Paenibacillus macerans]